MTQQITSYTLPPRALRVLHLPDRLVLHDITYALNNHDPCNRNALIDAANSVHTKSLSASTPPPLIDFEISPPPSSAHQSHNSSLQNSYLVLPFASPQLPHDIPTPYVADSLHKAGLQSNQDISSIPVDAAAALLGLLPLRSGVFAVLATHVRRAAQHPFGNILTISRVQLVPLCATLPPKEEKDALTAVTKLLESGSLYYAPRFDLTKSLATMNTNQSSVYSTPGPFCWNEPMSRRLPSSCHYWAPRAIYGFTTTHILRTYSDAFPSGATSFHLTLISRRSRLRAGTRYITRGVDAMGDVANFVETEQLVWPEDDNTQFTSYVVIRGSIPVFWRQNNGIARPAPELDGSLIASRKAFSTHFDRLRDSYGRVTAVSLVDLQGSEGVLAEAFDRHFDLYLRPSRMEQAPNLVAFDFHKWCGGKQYERGLGMLLERISATIDEYKFYCSGAQSTGQTGVFRVNCVDCLDRTNVVQSMICRKVLDKQIETIFAKYLNTTGSRSKARLYSESEDRFKHIWGDNADAVSKQYSGTGALKTDFTRTGKRSTTGVIGDGMKSVMRMYYKNFVDEGRQEVIDLMCGNISIQFPSAMNAEESIGENTSDTFRVASASRSSSINERSLWYSFQALRVNAGGDRQQVSLELYDDEMLVTNIEGVCLSYPRKSLVAWSKHDDGRVSSDKKSSCRLRLLYQPSYESPATTSPLDLQFRTGTNARENFLRALISWAGPEVSPLLGKQRIRVRILAALNTSDQKMHDWGLQPAEAGNKKSEVVALVIPEYHTISRSQGLAAVPIDVDESDYVLVGATALSERGPALAVLVSNDLESTVMMTADATTNKASSYEAGGAVGLALEVCGTTLCFVSARLNGPGDVYNVLSTLNLGRNSFDVTNQFHHFAIAGLLGNMNWKSNLTMENDTENRNWVKLGDGSSCYSLRSGLSVMRSSFPSLRYDDELTSQSMWKHAENTTRGRKSSQFICLADGIIEGRPGPELPSNLSQSIVCLMDLRGEDIKIPLGIEQNSHMTPMLHIYCEGAATDGMMSRPTSRATTFPEWRETLRLPMMPGDVSRIQDSFIIGQILVPSPLTDPIPAGHFVIPLAITRDGSSVFKVPCRLGGVHTGSLYGRVQVISTERGKSNSNALQTTPISNELVPVSRGLSNLSQATFDSKGGRVSSSKSNDNRMKKSNSSLPKALASTVRQKATIEEMNDTLNAARKKGSKQIKSFTNKLSSLLNQPSSNSTLPAYMSRISSDQASSNYSERPFSGSSGQEAGEFRTNGMSSSSRTRGVTGSLTNDRIQSSPFPTSNMPTNDHKGSLNSSSRYETNDFEASLDFQAAPVPSSNSLPSQVQGDKTINQDPLLKNLRDLSVRATNTGEQTRHAEELDKANTVDQLLSGLTTEKKNTTKKPSSPLTEDDWGDFEGAEPTPTPTFYPTRRQSKQTEHSLIEF